MRRLLPTPCEAGRSGQPLAIFKCHQTLVFGTCSAVIGVNASSIQAVDKENTSPRPGLKDRVFEFLPVSTVFAAISIMSPHAMGACHQHDARVC
jgi:hypothetical protein